MINNGEKKQKNCSTNWFTGSLRMLLSSHCAKSLIWGWQRISSWKSLNGRLVSQRDTQAQWRTTNGTHSRLNSTEAHLFPQSSGGKKKYQQVRDKCQSWTAVRLFSTEADCCGWDEVTRKTKQKLKQSSFRAQVLALVSGMWASSGGSSQRREFYPAREGETDEVWMGAAAATIGRNTRFTPRTSSPELLHRGRLRSCTNSSIFNQKKNFT